MAKKYIHAGPELRNMVERSRADYEAYLEQAIAPDNDVDIMRHDSRWIPWTIAILISLVLWAALIGLVFFGINIFNQKEDAPSAIFSERFQSFSAIGNPHPVVLLDPSLRKCIAGMQAPWGNHGLPY